MSLDGKLEDLGLEDILQAVSLSRKSGVLSLQNAGSAGRIVFLRGKIVHAASGNHPREEGKAPSKERIREIVLDLFNWTEGSFSFELREHPELDHPGIAAELLKVGIAPHELSLRGADPPVGARATALEKSLFDLRTEFTQQCAEGDSFSSVIHAAPGLHLLKSMLQELQNPSLGGGIFLLVLRFASEFMNRGVVFHVKDQEIVGLGQFGIDSPQADAMVRGMRIPIGAASPFSTVLEQKVPAKFRLDDGKWCDYFRDTLGGGNPEEVFLGPILSEGKPVAVLYGDNVPEMRAIGDTEPLEIFLSQAGMAMEKALLERRLQKKIAT